MAKKKPPAKKKPAPAKKTMGVASLTVSPGCFVKISTYSYDDQSGDITVTAAYRIPAGTTATATISYIDIVNDSTNSSAATVGTNTVTGTINLPAELDLPHHDYPGGQQRDRCQRQLHLQHRGR